MQRAAAAVWRRFAWLAHPVLLRQARELRAANGRRVNGSAGGGGAEAQRGLLGAGDWRGDAFSTIMQWLRHKLQQRQVEGGGEGAGREGVDGFEGVQQQQQQQQQQRYRGRKRRRRRGGGGVATVASEGDGVEGGGPAGVV